MSLESRKGYYGDLQGNWQKDRRRGSDRRKEQNVPLKDRRKMMARRKADQLLVEQEHKK